LGLACGFAGLARPELVLALPLVVVPLILFRRELAWKHRLQLVVGAAGATIIVLAPWVTYNMSRFESPVYMSSNFGSTLVATNCDGTYYGKFIGFKDYSCSSEVVRRQQQTNPRWERLDESQRDDVLRAEAMEYIRAHSDRVPVVVAARWGRIAGLYQPVQEIEFDEAIHGQASWLGYLMLVSYYANAGLAVVGLIVLRRRRVHIWPLVALPVIVLISVGTTFAQVRYRAPAEVVLVIGAAVALDALVAGRSRRRAPTTDIDLKALEAEEAADIGEPTPSSMGLSPAPPAASS
jgi:4-amino-4-deoxy-L-arabinose transferase-like glycosyltransferase